MTISKAAEFLQSNNNYLIICHKSPDGDTIGSGFALCYALRDSGKNANVVCHDTFSKRFDYIYESYKPKSFKIQNYITVDIAASQLMGGNYEEFASHVALCIDHHPSNSKFARNLLLDVNAAATCEIIYKLILKMNVKMTKQIAQCLYTGIATDTNCFRYSNTTQMSHKIAAKLIDTGIDIFTINRTMFDIKSIARMRIDFEVFKAMEFYFDAKCAVIKITQKLLDKHKIHESEIEGITAMTRQVEGVEIGVMLRERENGEVKASVRTSQLYNACEICKVFGGGGHIRAAGCLFESDIKTAQKQILEEIEKVLK